MENQLQKITDQQLFIKYNQNWLNILEPTNYEKSKVVRELQNRGFWENGKIVITKARKLLGNSFNKFECFMDFEN